MHEALSPLYEIFKLNSRLLLNCLDGMLEDQARWRPGPASNSAAFLALHLVDARHLLAKLIGLELHNPFAARLEGARSIEALKDLPSLDEIRAAWKEVTGSLRERLKAMTGEELARACPEQFPLGDKTVLGAITFLLQHDSYHIGQLAFLRKQAGLEAMRYT